MDKNDISAQLIIDYLNWKLAELKQESLTTPSYDTKHLKLNDQKRSIHTALFVIERTIKTIIERED